MGVRLVAKAKRKITQAMKYEDFENSLLHNMCLKEVKGSTGTFYHIYRTGYMKVCILVNASDPSNIEISLCRSIDDSIKSTKYRKSYPSALALLERIMSVLANVEWYTENLIYAKRDLNKLLKGASYRIETKLRFLISEA